MNNNVSCVAALAALLSVCANRSQAGPATATASSSGWGAQKPSDVGNETWRFSRPTAADTIKWSSGANVADDMDFEKKEYGPEQKFDFPESKIEGRQFTGFSRTEKGPLDSQSITSGNGQSSPAEDFLGRTIYTAKWTVNATGLLGTSVFADPNWFSTASGDDPWFVTPGDLDFIDEPTYNLYFSLGLEDFQFSPLGGIGLNASYNPVNTNINILRILISSTGVSAEGDAFDGMSFYRLQDLVEGPTEIESVSRP